MRFFLSGERMKFCSRFLGTALLGLLLSAGTAIARDWPAQPIHLIVPFSPGGGTDILARLMSPKLGALLGQPVVVEDKPGASSMIGTQYVARAAPNGYTLLMVDSTFFINPSLRSDLPYDTIKDFAPVVHLATGPVILVAYPTFKARTLRELVAEAKAAPGRLFYGSGPNGASTHLAGELFNLAAGVKLAHIPYKGTGEAFAAAISNQVPLTFTGISSAGPAIADGRLRALAVTGAHRNAAVPDVPTFTEAGVPGVDSSTHWQIVAPAGTPRDVIQRLNKSFDTVLRDPDIVKRVNALGYEVAGGTPDDLAALTHAEIAKWSKVIQAAHITVSQ